VEARGLDGNDEDVAAKAGISIGTVSNVVTGARPSTPRRPRERGR
jgi:DNA-binding LacI/PurR family transcriptional regulator